MKFLYLIGHPVGHLLREKEKSENKFCESSFNNVVHLIKGEISLGSDTFVGKRTLPPHEWKMFELKHHSNSPWNLKVSK